MVACTLSIGASFATEPESASNQKLKKLMEKVQERDGLGSASKPPSAAELSTRMQERNALLAQGEAALARSDTDAAQSAFERAALIQHAADTEMGLVRTWT
jgi:hypothetical protein